MRVSRMKQRIPKFPQRAVFSRELAGEELLTPQLGLLSWLSVPAQEIVLFQLVLGVLSVCLFIVLFLKVAIHMSERLPLNDSYFLMEMCSSFKAR